MFLGTLNRLYWYKNMSFGSQRGFAYTDDIGTVSSIRLDESNTELVNGVSTLPPAGATGVPSDLRVRKVKLLAPNLSTKTVTILTRAIYDAINIGSTFNAPVIGEENPSGTVFVVVQKTPEKAVRRVFSFDTGKLDGDQP